MITEKPRHSRLTIDQFNFIQNNKEKPYRVIAAAIGVSWVTVSNHINGYLKNEVNIKKKNKPYVRPRNEKDFATNGNFDINKWAYCSHV